MRPTADPRPRQSTLLLAAVFAIVFVVFGNVGAGLIINTLTADGVISTEEGRRWSLIVFLGMIVAGYVAFWFARRRVA